MRALSQGRQSYYPFLRTVNATGMGYKRNRVEGSLTI